ncbi:MAG: M16 family metallopeptidase [Candidatus Kapaibacterium sp.]
MAFAQKDDGGIFPYDYTTETLDNGLKVILIPMPGNGIVSYYSIVRTGSRDEYEPGYSGFAHFFEHMMFRGTKKYPGRVYDSIMISLGSNANAYTTDDYTCYHCNLIADDVERIMEIESDRFQNLFYDEQSFQTEAGAVYGEYLKTKTSPWFLVFEKISEVAFDKHTYKHTTMGFETDIIAMPGMYEYSKKFFKRYYRPENIVLMVVGDFNPEDISNKIHKYYGDWNTGYVGPKVEPEPEQTAERTAEIKYPGKTLPIVAIGYKGDAFDPADKSVAAAILLGNLAFGSNSELFKKLYIQEQKVQVFMPEFEYNRDPFLWFVFAQIKDKKDIGYVKEQIFSTIEHYRNNPPDAKKLEALKSHLKYDFLMNLDSPGNVAGSLARMVALTGGIDAVDTYFKTLGQVTPEDIQAAAKKYFVPEKRTVVTLQGGK